MTRPSSRRALTPSSGIPLCPACCQRLGLDQAIAVPLWIDGRQPGASVNPCLTPRENEVLGWLSFGKTDAQIAALLGVSPRTVQKHLEHIYVKFGVETRTAAVMRSQARQPAH